MESIPVTTPSLRDLGYLLPEEVATLVDVKPLTLSNWRAARKGPPFAKIHGNKIVYPMDKLRQWLAQRTVETEVSGTLANPLSRRARRRGG
jgi:hypothetical protein